MYFEELANDPNTWPLMAQQAADECFTWASHSERIAPLQLTSLQDVADCWRVTERRFKLRQYIRTFRRRWEELAAKYQGRVLFDFKNAARSLLSKGAS